jgi:hypothetical protein
MQMNNNNQRPSKVTTSPSTLRETTNDFKTQEREGRAQCHVNHTTNASTISSIEQVIMAKPKSSHTNKIHETACVGLILIHQAMDKLELDSKFNAQPRYQKHSSMN